jgi:colicin import membrane protein
MEHWMKLHRTGLIAVAVLALAAAMPAQAAEKDRGPPAPADTPIEPPDQAAMEKSIADQAAKMKALAAANEKAAEAAREIKPAEEAPEVERVKGADEPPPMLDEAARDKAIEKITKELEAKGKALAAEREKAAQEKAAVEPAQASPGAAPKNETPKPPLSEAERDKLMKEQIAQTEKERQDEIANFEKRMEEQRHEEAKKQRAAVAEREKLTPRSPAPPAADKAPPEPTSAAGIDKEKAAREPDVKVVPKEKAPPPVPEEAGPEPEKRAKKDKRKDEPDGSKMDD